jgi:hypothetical protein
LGLGGASGYTYSTPQTGPDANTGDTYTTNVPANNASGYGAGGGGGNFSNSTPYYNGKGGNGSAGVTVQGYNIASIVNPQIEIVIGAAGAPGCYYEHNGRSNAGWGSPGCVQYSTNISVAVQADVVPIVPQAIGSFYTGAVGSALYFPDLGPGYWEIYNDSGHLYLGHIFTGSGAAIRAYEDSAVSFFSSIRPYSIYVHVAGTIQYSFRSMANW